MPSEFLFLGAASVVSSGAASVVSSGAASVVSSETVKLFWFPTACLSTPNSVHLHLALFLPLITLPRWPRGVFG